MTRIVPSIAVAICMLSPASVRADSITITSGSVALGSVSGQPGLVGTLNGDMFSMVFSWGGLVILPLRERMSGGGRNIPVILRRTRLTP